jgi:glycerol-3-phosphate acyltransferase PlsX
MPGPITVAVDANGADLGPAEVARGAAQAAAGGAVRVLLFAPADAVGELAAGVEVVDSPVSIAKAPDPARAVRSSPDASIVRAVAAVTDGRAQALVSGGSTGAALAATLFSFKRARGVHRPALAVVVPAPRAPFLLLDAGANAEVRPEHLVQFASWRSCTGWRARAWRCSRTATSRARERATWSPPTRRCAARRARA